MALQVFSRADSQTARKTLAIFLHEIVKDKKALLGYGLIIPFNRLLYIVILPFLFSIIIQSLILHPHDWHYPLQVLAIAGVVSILSLITAYLGFEKLFTSEEKMRTRLLHQAMDNLMHHSDQFFASRKVGSLAGDVSTFSSSIMSFLDIIFLQASGIVVNFVASLVIISILSPVLLIPLGLATSLLVWRSIRAVASRGPLRHERKRLTSQLSGTIADIIGNLQIVRYFAMGNHEMKRIIHDRSQIESVAKAEITIIQRETFWRQLTLFSFQIITMGVCIWLFTAGNVTIVALIFAVTYLGRLTSTLFEITPIIRGMEQAFLDAANITDILDEEPEILDSSRAKELRVKAGEVVLSDVSFKYKDNIDTNVISNVSLVIKPGQRVGLAGLSGGGKTTLTKLLLRFADVTSGSIAIDGQNISKVSQRSLRNAIAYVPQEPYLFHRSLRENIAYGKPTANDEEIFKAIKRANAYEFIKDLPSGLDTIVGERGVKLSGGQRQRIAIARAILKDAPILILDEATSALDSESEKLIQDALEKLMKGRTSIVVAHRLSTIAGLDRIVILDHGSIIEDGSHRTLLAQKGMYASLWARQSGGFLEE
ncbi:MAG: putative transporter ATP-binding protein [Candidatus Saccharibacteria bacterium]|nr:putative transporter ATP-binding protein [Candidatus Saccharibacteria bacterium]